MGIGRKGTNLTEVLEPPQERLPPFLGGEHVRLARLAARLRTCAQRSCQARRWGVRKFVRICNTRDVRKLSRVPTAPRITYG